MVLDLCILFSNQVLQNIICNVPETLSWPCVCLSGCIYMSAFTSYRFSLHSSADYFQDPTENTNEVYFPMYIKRRKLSTRNENRQRD